MVKILLDTTYLLPLFGVDVGLEDFKMLFPKLLNTYNVMYNPISLVEAKWIILGLTRKDEMLRLKMLKRYVQGLKSILLDKRLKATELTNPSIEEFADELLLNNKLNDYFDRIIYSTAKHYNATLLTEDEKLIEISKTSNLKVKAIRWRKIAEELKRGI